MSGTAVAAKAPLHRKESLSERLWQLDWSKELPWKIDDITGNLHEITKSGVNVYPLLGGAFDTTVEAGAACGFTFYTVDQNFQLFDLGFRCCYSANPDL